MPVVPTLAAAVGAAVPLVPTGALVGVGVAVRGAGAGAGAGAWAAGRGAGAGAGCVVVRADCAAAGWATNAVSASTCSSETGFIVMSWFLQLREFGVRGGAPPRQLTTGREIACRFSESESTAW